MNKLPCYIRLQLREPTDLANWRLTIVGMNDSCGGAPSAEGLVTLSQNSFPLAEREGVRCLYLPSSWVMRAVSKLALILLCSDSSAPSLEFRMLNEDNLPFLCQTHTIN